MPQTQQTQVTPLKVRTALLSSTPQQTKEAEWVEPSRRGSSLLKNLAVSAALVLCAVTLRSGALPSLSDASDVIMTAATDDSLLDEQLGKLSFVNALFPEAVLVFGEKSSADTLSLPFSSSDVVHAWSQAEPYVSWHADEESAVSASSGEIIGIYHGNGDELLVQVMGDNGLSCLYGNLAAVHVQTGDHVSAGDRLGTLLPGETCVLEIRQDGISIDPALYLPR